MKTINQQRVMHWAHIIQPVWELNWSDAVSFAWYMHYMHKWLEHGIVKFVYYKADGSTRAARGTLHPELIPEEKRSKGILKAQIEAGVRKPNYKSIAYYDLDKKDWRAFRPEDFICECCTYALCPARDNNEEAFEDWKKSMLSTESTEQTE